MSMLAERLNIDAILARTETLCRRIAPKDLRDMPLYIVKQSIVPAKFGGASVADGYTCPCADLYLKDVIGSAWRGRGACMVVDDTQFTEQMDTRDIESAVAGTVLHELAHILERPAIYRNRQGAEPAKLIYEALCVGHIVATEPAPDSPLATAKPYLGHEAGFIRVALHLRHRAEAAGALVPLFGFCAGNLYGLSHPNFYRAALGDEPARLADASFKEIIATPYPEEFSRLWAADIARWLS